MSIKKTIARKKSAVVTKAKRNLVGNCSQRIKRPRKNGKFNLF